MFKVWITDELLSTLPLQPTNSHPLNYEMTTLWRFDKTLILKTLFHKHSYKDVTNNNNSYIIKTMKMLKHGVTSSIIVWIFSVRWNFFLKMNASTVFTIINCDENNMHVQQEWNNNYVQDYHFCNSHKGLSKINIFGNGSLSSAKELSISGGMLWAESKGFSLYKRHHIVSL